MYTYKNIYDLQQYFPSNGGESLKYSFKTEAYLFIYLSV